MRSVVATFPAEDFAAGRLTAKHAGLAVRMHLSDDILDDGLDMQYEILGADGEVRKRIVDESKIIFDAEFKVTQDRPRAWRATACFRNVVPLRGHPIYSLMLDHRDAAFRAILVLEAGTCIVRMDFEEEAAAKADALCAAMREALQNAGLTGTVRTARLGRSLEDWEPLAA